MSTRNASKRAALLASAALMGQDVATDAATLPVTKVAEGTRGNVKPISKATRKAVAAKAKAAKAKAKPAKRAAKVTSVVLDDLRETVARILNDGDKLDSDADKNCQRIVHEIAIAYEGMRKGASNQSDVPALAKMFDLKTRQLEKAGNAFIASLCDAWLGKKVQKPSANNKVTRAASLFYQSRAAKIKNAAKIFIAARGTALAAGIEAMPIWDGKVNALRVPLGIFIPPTRKGDEPFTFSDPQLQATTHVTLTGAVYDMQRYVMIDGARTQEREGGAFTMTHLLKRFWSKPSYLVTKQKPAGNASQDGKGKDENAEGLLTAKQKKAALKASTYWELIHAAVAEMGTDAMPTLSEVDKHGSAFNDMGKIAAWYGKLSIEAQQRASDAEAQRTAIAAQKGKPFVMAATIVPISEPAHAEPIVDLPAEAAA